jgi:transcriptional regulator with XRE-family HTH domain
MKHPRTYSPRTIEATKLLGARVELARRERRWTVRELADRIGINHVTMRKVELGDPSVRLGTAFEAASLVGVPLFHEDHARLSLESDRVDDRLAVLPRLARKPSEVNDEF